MSDGNRMRLVPLLPLRGKILDRFNVALANDHEHFRLMFDPVEKSKAEQVLGKLSEIIRFDEEKLHSLLSKIKVSRVGEMVVIDDYLDWDRVSQIEVNRPDLPGIIVDKAEQRYYPFAETAAHVIGYPGPPGDKEMEGNPLRKHPDFRIGRFGIEMTAEAHLHGRPGIKRVEVNAHGVAVRELSVDESISGKELQTTLDADLQRFASQRISNIGGVEKEGSAVVVIDIRNGGILAMASRPSFNPNEFVKGIEAEYWKKLSNDPDVPLINKAISNQYPPGSTFKMIVALAGLEAGIITPETSVFCPGYFTFGSRNFSCWKKEGHGTVNVYSAIEQSCNTYFYTISQRIGVDRIADMAKKFGLGKKTGIDLPHEKPGLIPSKDWKRKLLGQDWLEGETINTGIGQGYVLTTPLQLAIMAARLASGKEVLPTIFGEGENFNVNQVIDFESIGISEESRRIVLEGMYRVVNSPSGTANRSHIDDPTFAMAGKTGTSQVRGKKKGEPSSEQRKYKNHGLFVAFAPYDNPRFAISVVVEHGGSGAGAAAPVARDIMTELLKSVREGKYT